MESIYFIGFCLLVVIILFNLLIRRITIFEYERALKYKYGKFIEMLESGRHWYLPFGVSITKVDIRPRVVTIPGQEILSSDGVSVKVNLAATYEINDAYTAVNKVEDYKDSLYLTLQMALREAIGGVDIETILENRNTLLERMSDKSEDKIKSFGLNLLDVNVKDLMFPGALKEMFAQVAKAKREGQAALERARGETASLRSLANAAKMLETNPNLMNLRLMQTITESTGNTFVVNVTGQDGQNNLNIQ